MSVPLENSLSTVLKMGSSIELAKKKKFNYWECMLMFSCFCTWFLQVTQAFYGNLNGWSRSLAV